MCAITLICKINCICKSKNMFWSLSSTGSYCLEKHHTATTQELFPLFLLPLLASSVYVRQFYGTQPYDPERVCGVTSNALELQYIIELSRGIQRQEGWACGKGTGAEAERSDFLPALPQTSSVNLSKLLHFSLTFVSL